jgi:hypothetical protein
LSEFYSTVSGICFVLLGFWWTIAQFRHDEWVADPRLRRMAFHMSVSFLLPGTMSTVAILGLEKTWLWQTGFFIAAVLGALEAGAVLRSAAPAMGAAWFRAAHGAAVLLYMLIGIVALDPKLPSRVGIDLTGIEAEAVMVSVLLFVSANVAWLLMARPKAQPG